MIRWQLTALMKKSYQASPWMQTILYMTLKATWTIWWHQKVVRWQWVELSRLKPNLHPGNATDDDIYYLVKPIEPSDSIKSTRMWDGELRVEVSMLEVLEASRGYANEMVELGSYAGTWTISRTIQGVKEMIQTDMITLRWHWVQMSIIRSHRCNTPVEKQYRKCQGPSTVLGWWW